MANVEHPGLEPRSVPEKRRYLRLRKELELFLDLVRHLNQQVVEGTWEETEDTKAKMRKSVEQLAGKAGQTD